MKDPLSVRDAFVAHRAYLYRIARRMLGSSADAEDAVQEAWLRLSRQDREQLENVRAWLTTVVSRICLDMLRSRSYRIEGQIDDEVLTASASSDPEADQDMADTVELALLVVLQRLSPAERVVFVLHDSFGLTFEEIAPIVGRSPAATRQMASRARRRITAEPLTGNPGRSGNRELIEAFIAASKGGDMRALISMLDPDVVLRADAGAVRLGSVAELRGAAKVAEAFHGRAVAAQPAWIDDSLGIAVMPSGSLLLVLKVEIDDDHITQFEAIADPETLSRMVILPIDQHFHG